MKHRDARGKPPLLALLQLAKLKGWKAQLFEGGGDDSAALKEPIAGFAGLGLSSPGAPEFDRAERKFMLELARQTLTGLILNSRPPQVTAPSAKLCERRACFVTLTKAGALRGCIGNLLPQAPLYRAIVENAGGAALRDPRFPPVTALEIPELKIEISVLTEPHPLSFSSSEDLMRKLQPYQDGVLLHIGGRLATFLPQVWAQIPEKVNFLDQLARKAGFEAGAWRGTDVAVSVYQVESFEEPHELLSNN